MWDVGGGGLRKVCAESETKTGVVAVEGDCDSSTPMRQGLLGPGAVGRHWRSGGSPSRVCTKVSRHPARRWTEDIEQPHSLVPSGALLVASFRIVDTQHMPGYAA